MARPRLRPLGQRVLRPTGGSRAWSRGRCRVAVVDAGVVDEGGERTKLQFGGVKHASSFGLGGYVNIDGPGGGTGCGQFRDEGISGGLSCMVVNGDGGATAGGQAGGTGTEADVTADDQRTSAMRLFGSSTGTTAGGARGRWVDTIRTSVLYLYPFGTNFCSVLWSPSSKRDAQCGSPHGYRDRKGCSRRNVVEGSLDGLRNHARTDDWLCGNAANSAVGTRQPCYSDCCHSDEAAVPTAGTTEVALGSTTVPRTADASNSVTPQITARRFRRSRCPHAPRFRRAPAGSLPATLAQR
jgi:hypothetical protein